MTGSSVKKVIGKSLTDLILVGSIEIDSDDVETTINTEYLYLEFDDSLFLFSSIEEMSELNVTEKDEIDFSYEIDEDDRYFSTSIRNLYLVDTISDIAVKEVNEYRLDDKLKGVEIILENNQMLFIDPTYYTGIKLGGEIVKNMFLENHAGVQVISL